MARRLIKNIIRGTVVAIILSAIGFVPSDAAAPDPIYQDIIYKTKDEVEKDSSVNYKDAEKWGWCKSQGNKCSVVQPGTNGAPSLADLTEQLGNEWSAAGVTATLYDCGTSVNPAMRWCYTRYVFFGNSVAEDKKDGHGCDSNVSDAGKAAVGSGSSGGNGGSSATTPWNPNYSTFFTWGECGKGGVGTKVGGNDGDGIMCVITVIFNWAAIGVSVIVVLMVIVGAIVYMTAAGSNDKAKKGIEIIRNAIIALVLYMIMWALLNFLVPGGVFG